MRKVITIAALIVVSGGAFADQPLTTTAAARELADRVVDTMVAGDFDGAFKLLKSASVIPEADFDSVLGRAKPQYLAGVQRYGKNLAREFVREDKVGDSLYRVIELDKFEKTAIRWVFVFYRTKDGWLVNDFLFDDKVRLLFCCDGGP